MSNGIPLPPVNPNTKRYAHPYPYQIGLQCQRLMHGTTFYHMLMDSAAGQYVRSEKEAYSSVKKLFIETGISESEWELGWQCMIEYTHIFPNPLIHIATLSMVSNWDWYISNLGKFLAFCIHNTSVVQITKKQQDALSKLHTLPFDKQLDLLRIVLNNDLPIDQSTYETANELFLARHLGVHKNWVVDQQYLDKTIMRNCVLGQVLQIDGNQLAVWRSNIGEIVTIASRKTAIAFISAPNYP